MTKVIISFLGTGGYTDRENRSRGKYRKAKYKMEGSVYETEFVSEALLSHYNADRVIVIGTLKSMWDVIYDNDSFVPDVIDESWAALAELVDVSNYKTEIEKGELIKKVFLNTKITPIIVKYGLSKEENEYNIQQLFSIENSLQNDDELFIDVSHGFRSLPIVLTNIINFITENSKKKISVKTISYAMFEVSHEMDGVTPIINLDLIKELQQSVKAAHEFNEYGNAYLFSKLLESTNKSMSKILKDFSYSKGLNHLYDLRSKIAQLKGFKYDSLTPIQKYIIPQTVENFIYRFGKCRYDSQFQFEIGKWMFENKQYGSASVAIVECLITKVCELEKLDHLNKDFRDCAKFIINIAGKNEKNVKSQIKKIRLKKCKPEILHHYKNYVAFQKVWGETNVIRKSVSHSISTKLSVSKMVADIERYLLEVEKLVY